MDIAIHSSRQQTFDGYYFHVIPQQMPYPYHRYIIPLGVPLMISFAYAPGVYQGIRLDYEILSYRTIDDHDNLRTFYVSINCCNIVSIGFFVPYRYPRYIENISAVNMNGYNLDISSKLRIICWNDNGTVNNEISEHISSEIHEILTIMNANDYTLHFTSSAAVQHWRTANIQPGLQLIRNRQISRVLNEGKVICVAKFRCPSDGHTWFSSKVILFVDIPSHLRLTNINQVKQYINPRRLSQWQSCKFCRVYGQCEWYEIFDPLNPEHRIGGTHQTSNCNGCKIGICDGRTNTMHPLRFRTAMSMIRQLHGNMGFNAVQINGKTIINVN